MKTFNEQYYINLTPWKKKLDLDEIPKFNNISYKNTVILHFDFISPLFMISTTKKPNKTIFIAAINICLRISEIIRKVYPYNKVYVVIHTKKVNMSQFVINFDTFKSIIDIIPNFAIVTKENNFDLDYYNQENYNHIFYGFNSLDMNKLVEKFNQCKKQYWKTFNGKLIVKEL